MPVTSPLTPLPKDPHLWLKPSCLKSTDPEKKKRKKEKHRPRTPVLNPFSWLCAPDVQVPQPGTMGNSLGPDAGADAIQGPGIHSYH